MKKKLAFIIGCIIVVLALSTTAFAATSDVPAAQAIRSFCGIDTSTLTDQQKADLEDSYSQMIELRKQTINKMVENGSITKEQGDAALKNIVDMAEYHQENGFVGGMGMGGFGGGHGMRGGWTLNPATSN